MVKFGPAGNCKTFYEDGNKKSVEAPKWLSEKGLTAYEYSFGRGITLTDETATLLGQELKKYNIEGSIHAPYYINFANPSDEMAEKSYMYVINSLAKLRLMGGNRLVVHPASCGKLSREDAVELTKKRLTILNDKLVELGYSDMLICLETMGKYSQIGSYEEIVELCKVSKMYVPTLDFGHINCLLQGGLKTEADFDKVVTYVIDNLGYEKANKMHIHFSKIEFSVKGEIRHLTLEDTIYGPEFLPLAKVLKKHNLNPVIISESSEFMGRDAQILSDIYKNA